MSTHTVPAPDRWVAALSLVVPRDIRHHFVGDLLADRRDMEQAGSPKLYRNLASAKALLNGFAQHVPLRSVDEEPALQTAAASQAARGGWLAWRVAGPLLFAGHLTGSAALLVAGGAAVVAAYACLVAVGLTGREPLTEAQVRLLNGVLGGTVCAILLVLVFGLLTSGLLALAGLFGAGGLASLAMSALAFVATIIVCAITGSGWVPDEWAPHRLIRN